MQKFIHFPLFKIPFYAFFKSYCCCGANFNNPSGPEIISVPIMKMNIKAIYMMKPIKKKKTTLTIISPMLFSGKSRPGRSSRRYCPDHLQF
jgi:hypothetical protein